MIYIILSVILFFLILIFFKYKPIVRGIIYNYPDKNDNIRFQKNTIFNNPDLQFRFNKLNTKIDYGESLILDDWKFENALRKNLRDYIIDHKTNGFIIIKEDSVLFEEYYRDMNSNSFFPSYSIAKSILAILTGIAIEEKYFNENDLIINYIPELKQINKADSVLISDLLNHTSGIKTNRYIDAILYYGDNFWDVIKHLKISRNPGEYQEYQNINSQLLGLIISRTTNKTLSEYLQEKIWKKIGTSDIAFWNIFKDNNIEKCFCCLNAKAIDYAKFGRLILNKGKFNNKQIVSEKWIKSITETNTYRGSSRSYNKSWYLGLKEYQDFMAIGLYKQFIYIAPKKNIIIIRLGEREKKLHEEKARWARTFREIVDQL